MGVKVCWLLLMLIRLALHPVPIKGQERAAAAPCCPGSAGSPCPPENQHSRSAAERESTCAPNEGPFFYTGLRFGSEAYIGPLDVLLNKGFDLAQVANRDRGILDYPYATGHVADAIANPLAAVDRYGGWGYFLRTQVLPLTFDERRSKWYPNFFGHAVTGGIVSRRLAEWFETRDIPRPEIMAGVVSMVAAMLNEAYEHPGMERGSAGTVADLYIFDLGGVLLFSNDDVARFFSRKLHATVWPAQASLTIPSGQLLNAANHVVFKIPWGVIPETSIFFRTGVSGHLGLTLHQPNDVDLSFGLGFEASEMHFDPTTGEEWVDFVTTVGVFMDRKESLLASAVVSAVPDRLLTLNVYPGVLRIFGGELGAWIVLTRSLSPAIGISTRKTLGLGLGIW